MPVLLDTKEEEGGYKVGLVNWPKHVEAITEASDGGYYLWNAMGDGSSRKVSAEDFDHPLYGRGEVQMFQVTGRGGVTAPPPPEPDCT
jgi:hypothetical protein